MYDCRQRRCAEMKSLLYRLSSNAGPPFGKMEVTWNGVYSAPSPGVTTQNAPCGEQKTFYWSMNNDGLPGIFGAGGDKTAR